MGADNLVVVTQVCRFLRSKGMYIHAEPDPTVPYSDGGYCWCIHTMNCLGPDGQVVDRDNCRSGRTCYREY